MKKSQIETVLTPVESALQAQFKGVSKTEIASAFFAVEAARENWLVQAMAFGMAADAMKAQLPHGSFRKWMQDAFSEYSKSPNVERVQHLETNESVATAIRYLWLWRKIKAQIEAPHENSNFGKRLIEYAAEKNVDAGKLPSLLSSKDSAAELLGRVLKGYGLRSLTSALTEANADAIEEDERENSAIAENGKGGWKAPVGGGKANPQMELWEDWTNEFDNIDQLIGDPAAKHLEDRHWLGIEQRLRDALERVEKITAPIRKRQKGAK